MNFLIKTKEQRGVLSMDISTLLHKCCRLFMSVRTNYIVVCLSANYNIQFPSSLWRLEIVQRTVRAYCLYLPFSSFLACLRRRLFAFFLIVSSGLKNNKKIARKRRPSRLYNVTTCLTTATSALVAHRLRSTA